MFDLLFLWGKNSATGPFAGRSYLPHNVAETIQVNLSGQISG